jgi:hypothetical protein
MRLVAAPGVAERVREEGGRLFVWPKTTRCCRGRLTYLEAATQAPAGVFRRVAGDGFEVFLDARMRRSPDELHVELHGRRRSRLAAYWNGCAYVI